MSILVRAAVIRAVRTVAQTALATIGSSAVLADVNWPVVASASTLAGLLSLLSAVAGLPEAPQILVDWDDLDDDGVG